MENKKTVYRVRTCQIKENEYCVTLDLPDRFASMAAHSYPHMPGGNVEVAIYYLSPEDILQIGDAIRKVALDLKPELNESLTVGAGI